MRSFSSATGGNVSVLFALAAIVILGAAGLGLDFALWNKERTELQQAADAGATAGAVELGRGGRNASARAQTRALALGTVNRSGPTASAVSSVVVDTAAQTVTVAYTMPGRRSLSAVLVKSDPTIIVASTAKVVNRVVACIYALNPSAPKSMFGNGSAVLQGTNCAIQVNSADAVALDNSGTIDATHICVVGGYSGSGYTPSPQAGCPVADDPFAATIIPAAGACTQTNLAISSTRSLSPGVYCGGVSITSGAVVTLNPGLYHIVNGPLKVAGGASLRGDGVAFILSGTASLDIAGTGEVITSPPASGDLTGFSIVQDRAAPLGGASKISGEGHFEFPGIIYMPRQNLEIRGRAAGNTYVPIYAAVVADKIIVAGQGELRVTADTSVFSKKDASKLTVVNVALIK